jgi:membrane fusion protein (multidrug efflux system)
MGQPFNSRGDVRIVSTDSMGRVGRITALAAAAVGLSLTLGACHQRTGDANAGTPPVPEVGVVTLQAQPVPVVTELPGRISATQVAEVRARASGIVLQREFTEGAEVKEGQRLYQIDPAPYVAALHASEATLAKAQATVVSAAAEARRYKALVDANAISRQDYDNAVAAEGSAAADVAAGKAAVETARINLGYAAVTSPISGRIGKSSVTRGAYVQSSDATLMATVQQLDTVYVDLTQASLDGLRLRKEAQDGRLKLNGANAAKVTLFLEDGHPYGMPGQLQFSDVTVDQATGSVTLRAVFANPQRLLLPGMFVRARIDEGTNEQALLVPQVGVTHDAKGQATALVVGADNKVALRQLSTGTTQGQNWVVQAGLNAGDRVIVAGVDKVSAGMIVKPVAAATPATASNAATLTSSNGSGAASAAGSAL